ncbi:MAG: hypothetical protein EP329_16025 [Deltaproteobacteria bacterium]|nr:MAG: hypothetical protein EP329_16025 [Deltaproteobacteria bacterium]
MDVAILDRVVDVEGEQLTVEQLRRRHTAHVTWSLRDIAGHAELRPSPVTMTHAAALLGWGTPTLLVTTAAWLELLAVLEGAGLDARERFAVAASVVQSTKIARGFYPTSAVLSYCAAQLAPEEAAAFGAGLLAGTPTRDQLTLAAACYAAAPDAELPEALDPVRYLSLPAGTARALLARLPDARRELILLRMLTPRTPESAGFHLEAAAVVADLLTSDATRAAYRRLVKSIRGLARKKELEAMVAAGGPEIDAAGVSALIRPALAFWEEHVAAALRSEGLGPLAEHAALMRVPVADAAELASMEAWTGAPPERRVAVAEHVVTALGEGFSLVGIEEHGGPPIALIAYGASEQRFALLPGGTFTRGMSAEEEALVHAGAAAAGLTESYEEYGQLVDLIPTMRPTAEVRVEPFLLGPGVGEELAPEEVADWIAESPWRLPTEAEWEYAARGGVAGELHYLGTNLPLEAHLHALEEHGPEARNRFGLWGFGLLPEICADAWAPTFEDAPVDGSPRTGDGPRAVRGGAALVAPWQGCGEWQLLLTAMRGSQSGWDFAVGVRPAIGLQV